MDLDALISGLDIRRSAPPGAHGVAPPVRICDITEDSRSVMPGSLFVARKGDKFDGRAYAPAAVAAGAVAVLVEAPPAAAGTLPLALPPGGTLLLTPDISLATARLAERFYGEPSSRLTLCGVTGTNGKTTITFLIHQLLNAAHRRCGLMGTVLIDDGSEIAPASLTTAPSLEISRTLARMLECGCTAAAIEASSHALHQRRVGALRFQTAVFTNLTHDHLDYHGTMENYAAAKAMLFSDLAPDAVAVINADDPWAARMVRDCRAKIVRCSLRSRPSAGAPAPDWHAAVLSADARRTVVQIQGPFPTPWRLTLPLIGEHNVYNALQAAAAAHAMGLAPEAVAAGLEKVTAPPGRLEPVTTPASPLACYVDYAHTDDALGRVIKVLRTALRQAAAGAQPGEGGTPGRLTVVFGCGGDRDRTKRPKMGALAAEGADRVIVTSDNPRTEDPRVILEQILAGVPASQRHKVTVEPDRAAAIALAVAEAKPGDALLIAGKGHEDYQILPDGSGGVTKIHFDDREHARAALAARGIPVTSPALGPVSVLRRAPARKDPA